MRRRALIIIAAVCAAGVIGLVGCSRVVGGVVDGAQEVLDSELCTQGCLWCDRCVCTCMLCPDMTQEGCSQTMSSYCLNDCGNICLEFCNIFPPFGEVGEELPPEAEQGR